MNMRGAPWTEEEKQGLFLAFNAGATIEELAASHERTGNSIVSQLVHHEHLVQTGNAYYRVSTPFATFGQLRSMK